MGGVIRRTSISLPKELLEQARLVARLRRRNFSNYVADLIASDLAAFQRQHPEGCEEGEPPEETPASEKADS